MRIVILAYTGRKLKEYPLEMIRDLMIEYGKQEGIDGKVILKIFDKSMRFFKNEMRRLG